MIDLSGKAPADDLVKETTDHGFMADVIEASRKTPVIVDFWAPWCGPCRTLGPMLEEAVRATKGKVRMVKVDVDRHQMVAQQLRVQSIPAVFAFVDGQPVDGFMGALPASEIKAFVQRLMDGAGGEGEGAEAYLEAAEQMLATGQAADAAETFAAILAELPENARAHAGMIRAVLATGDVAGARMRLDAVPAAVAADPAVAAVRASVELAEQAAGAGEVGELRARLAEAPQDHQARFDLALALMGEGDAAGAVEELLELFRRDREWNDGAAREQLMKLFDSLGPKDPVARSGRRRLSSMIFA